MRIAIPHWNGRVSPVLDVAGALLLVDVSHGKETNRQSIAMQDDSLLSRARRISALGVNTIVCGAISRHLELALASNGIEVIPQTCGAIDEILEAYLAGRLQQEAFLMPGCCGRRKRFRGGRKTKG